MLGMILFGITFVLRNFAAGMGVIGMTILLAAVLWVFNIISQKKQIESFYLPKDEERFKRWQTTYSIIHPLREQGWFWKQVIAKIQIDHPDLPYDQKTLRKILETGDSGCLDNWPSNVEECYEKRVTKKKKKTKKK
jgi:hypothetical protein